MFELILTIFLSSLIIICFRLIYKFKIDELESIVFNYLFAGLWGLLVWGDELGMKDFIDKPWFELSIFIGLMFILTFYLVSRSTSKAGLAITAVASRISVLIPVIAGFLLYSEELSILKFVGIALSIISFFLVFKPRGDFSFDVRKVVIPILLFLGVGTNDSLMKYIQVHLLQGDETLFLTSVFIISLVIGLVILLVRNLRASKRIDYRSILWGLILGSLNFGSTYFFIRSMMQIESSLFFPAFNVGIVILTSVTGLLFFGERLSRINWIGIFTAAIAIAIITIG